MCNKHSSVILELPGGKKIRVDPCLRKEILWLNKHGIETLACCCGHGKYKKSIIYNYNFANGTKYLRVFNLTTKKVFCLSRKKRFYFKDSEGVYYIPELEAI